LGLKGKRAKNAERGVVRKESIFSRLSAPVSLALIRDLDVWFIRNNIGRGSRIQNTYRGFGGTSLVMIMTV